MVTWRPRARESCFPDPQHSGPAPGTAIKRHDQWNPPDSSLCTAQQGATGNKRGSEASRLSAHTRAKLHDILYGVSSFFLQFLYPMMQFHRFSNLTLTDSASKVGAVFTGIQSSLCVQLHNDRSTQRRSYLPV